MAMEVTSSTQVMQDTNTSPGNDDSASAAVAADAKPNAEDQGPGMNDEPQVQLVSHPDESVDEIPHEVGKEVAADRFLEHSPDSGSKSKFVPRLSQGSKSGGRQKGRKPRGAGSIKIGGSSPSQPIKPYESDQTSEDNENRSSSKKQAKRKTSVTTVVYDDNDPSTTRRQPQRGDEENPARRLVLADVTPSELNKRMGTTPTQTPEKHTPIKTATNLTPIQVTSIEEISPILSLQRSASTIVQVHSSDTDSEAPDEEDTIESALRKRSEEIYGLDDSGEEHDSDKENVPGTGTRTVNSRQPLQTLYSAPSPSDIFATPQQLNRARFQAEEGRQWQMTVDTNCLLNSSSLESLKRLRGVHETRLVIPSIVVTELDYLRRREESKARATSALEWIASCMLEMPFWIHVQSSAETVHVAMTPPVSPSIYTRGFHPHIGESDMMQPTLHDHVLECALFQHTTLDRRVAILTDDTTLKIKALAEGLVVDTPTSFSDSLLNPYSERFVYSGSTPIGRSSEKQFDGFSSPRSTISSSKWPAISRPTSRVNFSIWRSNQPIGLQVLLA